MFDAIELEKRGIPTVTIAHDTFFNASKLHAKILGLPDVPLVVEPAPASGVVGENIEQTADETFDQLLHGLVAMDAQRDEGQS